VQCLSSILFQNLESTNLLRTFFHFDRTFPDTAFRPGFEDQGSHIALDAALEVTIVEPARFEAFFVESGKHPLTMSSNGFLPVL